MASEESALHQNLWERYGFRGDPFETGPLPVNFGQGLSVGTAYIERTGKMNPGTVLQNFLRNPGGGRIVVEGEPGVGKTTFVNFHRYEWGSDAKPPLLSPVSEISVKHGWSENDFLISLIAALSARIRLELDEGKIAKDKLFQQVSAITGVRREKKGGFGFNITVLGSGGGITGSGKPSYTAGNLTTDDLRNFLRRLVQKAKTAVGCSGVIFHLDNLELLKRQGEQVLANFFDDIRDAIQEPDVYFIFVGYRGMFQNTIVPNSRVRSIFFDKPLYLKPLSKKRVHEIIQRRYELLAAKGKTIIKPVDDRVIEYLYDAFDAKLRPIMNAVTSLVSHLPDSVAETLGREEAVELLREIQLSEIEAHLTDAEKDLFLAAVRLKRFTPTALAEETKKSKQMINKHLNRLMEHGYLYQAEKAGRSQYYEVESKFRILSEESS